MEETPLKIGKYPVIDKLAEGGTGALYKAKHPTLDTPVIIKKLMFMDRPTLKERFRREAQIMMDLRCDQIVQVYDHFREESAYYIVMQYVKGTDLHQLLLQNRYLPNDIALLIFSEVGKALKYAHERKIIHRDVKPANILIAENGAVQLTDFGVAASRKFDDELTQVGMTLGTPAYMAPEQITDPDKVDQRADIYSLGVVLYFMVTGQKPFQGGSTAEIIASVSRGQYRPPRKINPEVLPQIQRIIKKCVHPKVAKRYKHVAEVLDKCAKYLKPYKDESVARETLRRYFAGESPTRETVKDALPSRKVWTRGRRRLALAVLMAAFFLAAGLWGLRQGYYYELIRPDDYGSLIVEAALRKDKDAIGHTPLRCVLYVKQDKKWEVVEGVHFTFQQVDPESARNVVVLRSNKQFLPTGTYKIRMDAGNEQYHEAFYLPPLSVQRQQVLQRDGYRLKISMEPNPPGLPLKLKYRIKNQLDQKSITNGTKVYIKYRLQWISWDTFSRKKSLLATFVSGKTYRFRFKKDHFYRQDLTVQTNWDQTVLNLEVNMIPHPGYLLLDLKVGGLKATLNHLDTFFEGGKKFVYKPLEPFLQNDKKVTLPAGQYFLTVSEDKSWWERLSFFPPDIVPARTYTRKIQIEPWRTLRVSAELNPKENRLILNVKP
jgi:serine/threonine-protein kinase